jgi:hypothetical protein
MHKRGVELAINMIILVTLGLLVLAFGAFFIQDLFQKMHRVPFPESPNTASADDPINVLQEGAAKVGKDSPVRVDVFNRLEVPLTEDDVPSFSCAGNPPIGFSALGLRVEPGELHSYVAIVAPDEGVEKLSYPCSVSIGDLSGQFILELKA